MIKLRKLKNRNKEVQSMLNGISNPLTLWRDPLGYVVDSLTKRIPIPSEMKGLAARISVIWFATAVLLRATALNLIIPFPIRCLAGCMISVIAIIALKGRLIKYIAFCNHHLSVPVKILLISSIVLSVAIPVILEVSGLSLFSSGMTQGLSLLLAYLTGVFTLHVLMSSVAIKAQDQSIEKVLKLEVKQFGKMECRLSENIQKILQFIYSNAALRLIFWDHVKRYQPDFRMKVYASKNHHILAKWAVKRYQVVELDAYLNRLQMFVWSHSEVWQSFYDHLHGVKRHKQIRA